MKKRKYRGTKWLLVVTVLFCELFLVRSVNANEEIIKVGFCTEEGYHTVGKNNNHSGYDYEYLMRIADFTGWKYEFVEGTWKECVQMLEKGEIDLLGGIQKNDERLKHVVYAKEPTLFITNCLLIEKDSNSFAYEDFEAFNGMKIGVLSDNGFINFLEQYSVENNFSYELKFYETEQELKTALKSDEVDCVHLVDMRNLSDYKVIARFGYVPMYYALNEDRKDLQADLNNAIQEILTENQYYESYLHNKYFYDAKQVAFTLEEMDYISKHPEIDVMLFDDFPLICTYNENTKKYEGIIIDILNELSKRTNITFNYINIPLEERWPYLIEHPNTIIAPTLNNELVEFDNNIAVLDEIIPGKMIAVTRKNETLDLSLPFRLAFSDTMLGAEENLKKKYPNAEIIGCESIEDKLSMLNENKADMTLINEYAANYYLQSPFNSNLAKNDMEYYKEDITISLSVNSDPALISILYKAKSSFSDRDLRQIVIDNTSKNDYDLNLREWVYKYKEALFLLVILVIALVFSLRSHVKYRLRKKEELQQQKIAEEKHRSEMEYQKKLLYQAYFDSLTKIYNKEYFIEKTNVLLRENPDVTYAFIRIDIEKFKMINEIYGSKKADMILIKLANYIKDTVGGHGVYARIYSDHFAICYPMHDDKLYQLTHVKPGYIEVDGQKIRFQLRLGIYINENHYTDAILLLDYAQIALQENKKIANQNVNFFKEDYLKKLVKNQEITNEMEKAFKEHQFKIYLQPQYEIISNKMVGAEALVRWIHPEKGIVSPGDFIPIFEENHFIYQLDCYVFEEVCKELVRLKETDRMLPISVNLSRVDFQNPNLVPTLTSYLEKYQIPAKYIHLEITESAYTDDQDKIIAIVSELQNLGFLIEMDDFGSGYSSLNMLKDIPVDVLKLDLRFFGDETHMDKGGNIVGSIVELAHNLGMIVIAEGVETEREINFLRSVHSPYVQGFFYSRPIPVDAFEELLKKSDLEDKVLKVNQQQEQNLYWRTEKFNNLLCENHAVLFDYDPTCDYAIFTYTDSKGQLRERTVHLYCENILTNKTLHPDDRPIMKAILENKNQARHIEYKADYMRKGSYLDYEASFHYYFSKENLNRVIAVIKRK